MSKITNILLFVTMIGYGIYTWLYYANQGRNIFQIVIATIVCCGIPTIVACFTASLVPANIAIEVLAAALSFVVVAINIRKHEDIFINVIPGIITIVLFLFINTPLTEDQMLDSELSEGVVFADDAKIQELYRRGARPKNYYGDIQRRGEADDKLIQHGVNPYE